MFIPFFKEGNIVARYSLGAFNLSVTHEGLMIFWNILIKSYLIVLNMILLSASINFSDFLKALEDLKIPRIFVMISSFMYRYIFLLEDELMKMKQAKDSRSISSSRWLNIKVLANMLGILFIRAYERGENVYLSMCSRGFDGRARTLNSFQLKIADFIFLVFILTSLVGIRIMGI